MDFDQELTITRNTLQDFRACPKLYKQQWKETLLSSYEESDKFIFDNPLVDKFKWFTCHPGNLLFYIKDNKVERYPEAVKSRYIIKGTEHDIDINPATDMLLYLKDHSETEFILRYIKQDKVLI